MSELEIKKKHRAAITDLRRRAATKSIFTFTELARLVPCSRIAIYLSLERPSRFPNVINRLEEILDAKTTK